MKDKSPSQQIDDIIRNSSDWRGKTLAQLRAFIVETNPEIYEEIKWKKPSKPEGVPVWSCNGILCVADTLKNSIRLTFPKGSQIKDPTKLFNSRLDSKTVRAIDFFENDDIDGAAITAIILEAISLNKT